MSEPDAKDFLSKYKQRYPKVFAFLELQERLLSARVMWKRSWGDVGPSISTATDSDACSARTLEIDLDVARRGGMEPSSFGLQPMPDSGSVPTSSKWPWCGSGCSASARIPARLLLQVHDELVLEVDPHARGHP